MSELTKENIANTVSDIIANTRQWCKSLVELWQQVPNLALEADGRTGYLDDLCYCYQYGYWRIWASSPRGGYLLTSVDCATGELVNVVATSHKKELVLSSDSSVLQLLSRLDDIDAILIIDSLKNKANGEIDPYIARVNPTWESKKTQIRKQNGLSFDEPYIRITNLGL